MPGEPNHPVANSTSIGTEKHRQLDHEIRDMIAALTKRLAELQDIHKSGAGGSHGHGHGDSSHHHHQLQQHIGDNEDDHHGVRIITLAGNNQGAMMHGERDDKSAISDDDDDPYEALGTYVNSNFQAINNSIMIGGSYTTNDPGVHMDISDVIDHHRSDHYDLHGPKMEADGKKGNKKKKAERENGKGEQHHSDKSD